MAKSTIGITGATYAGLGVSLKETAVCIVDEAGKIIFERMLQTDPRLLASCLAKHAPSLERFGIESGATSAWLWREFRARGLPVVCLGSRHAHCILSMKRNKNDRNDARGLGDLVRMGWHRPRKEPCARHRPPSLKRTRWQRQIRRIWAAPALRSGHALSRGPFGPRDRAPRCGSRPFGLRSFL